MPPRDPEVPTRLRWDPDEAAETWHGEEITEWRPVRADNMHSSHRHDYTGLGRKK